jgi:hypothetical protein
MHTQHTKPAAGLALANAAGAQYRRDQPRILTANFAHELAAANYARRTQRCPWLKYQPAQSLARTGMQSDWLANAPRARPGK